LLKEITEELEPTCVENIVPQLIYWSAIQQILLGNRKEMLILSSS